MTRRAVAALLTVLLASGVAGTRAAERAWITVLSTTDLHGNLLPIDYYTDMLYSRTHHNKASRVLKR